MVTPTYYSSLAPFQSLFATGWPVLTYHKVGPRPRRARLKGLYVSPTLFARQLAELRAGGLQSRSLADLIEPTAESGGRIVLTFDDGFTNVLTHALEPLASHQYRAIQFLVPNLLGKTNQWDAAVGEAPEPLMDASQVRVWLAAGHEIGSHTLTHPYLTRLSLSQAREEIAASKKRLEDLFGVPVRHFCYPYGDWNQAVLDLVRAAGYLTACTTEFGVNTPATDRFALRRITARYPSRNLRAFAQRIGSLFRR